MDISNSRVSIAEDEINKLKIRSVKISKQYQVEEQKRMKRKKHSIRDIEIYS